MKTKEERREELEQLAARPNGSEKRYLILSRSFIPFEKTSDWNTYDRSDTRPRVSTAEYANAAVSRKAVANAWAKPAQGNR
jgi:hypothetical protein